MTSELSDESLSKFSSDIDSAIICHFAPVG